MFNFFKRLSSPPSSICPRLSAKWSSRSFLAFSNRVWKCWKAEIFNCDWGMLLLSHRELTFPAPSRSFLLPRREIARFRAFEINNPSFYGQPACAFLRRLCFAKGQSLQLLHTFALRCHVNRAMTWRKRIHSICVTRWFTTCQDALCVYTGCITTELHLLVCILTHNSWGSDYFVCVRWAVLYHQL